MMRCTLDINVTRWAHLTDELNADVYFTPEYHSLHSANGDGVAMASEIGDGHHRLLIPGLRIAIAEGRSDLQSCNGYGGPLGTTEEPSFIEDAWTQWREAAAREQIVAALFRLHPLADVGRFLPRSARVLFDRQTIFVPLNRGLEQVWKSSTSRHRNMVNKGRRQGIDVDWQSAPWDEFEQLYGQTMDRLGAARSLRFSSAYFAKLSQLRWSELASVRDGRGLVAASVFLWGPRYGHYHLSARRLDAENHLLNCILQNAFERAHARGLLGVHLGGGTAPGSDNPLFRFKQSMGGELRDFKVALIIADATAYEHLCADWSARAGRPPSWLLGYRQALPHEVAR